MAFALDVAILTLLVFYKFNFIFPGHNQFIFSGDFIRPITLESSIKYYIYPFVLNEHGTFVDPTVIVRIPYWSLVTLFSYIIPLNLSYWLLIVVTQILSGLLISTSSRTLFSLEKKFSYYMIPLVPAIFAIFSYPINYRPYWLFLPLLPGLLQCVLIISYKTLINHKLSIRTKLLLVLIGYLAILQVHNIIFILITLTSVFFLTALLEKKRLVIIKDYLLITFWLSFPFLLFMTPTLMASFSGQLLSPPYVYSYSVLEFMSSKASFVNAFTFSIGFWEKVVYTNLDKLITLLIVSFVVMSYSLIKKRKSFLLSIFLAFVISLSFQLGINNPIYKSLSDPSNQFVWVLRDPFKISLVSLGLFTTIFTFTIKHLSINITPSRKILASFIMVLVILSVAVWSPATKTSKIIQPSTIPKEYFTAIDYLNENTDGPLLFLPIEGKRYTWADNPYLQGSFLARSYQGNYIDYTVTSKEVKELLIYATSTKNLKVLPLVTSGIVIDASIEGGGSCFDKMAHYILNNCAEDIVKLGDYLYFLPNEEYSRFRIVGDPLYLMASTDYMYLGSIGEFLNMGQGVVFFDSFEWPLRNAEEIKLSSKVTNPSIAWSLGYTHEPLHGPWHSYLETRNIRNWQSDYGKGLVFTWAPSRLKENPTPDNNDLINQWFFNSLNDLYQWKNYTRENQFGSLCTLTLDNGALKAELWNSTWGWKTINSPLIEAEYGNWYRWEFQIKAENAHGVHVKIAEYNQDKKLINDKEVKHGGSGTFNWQTATIDYTPENPETKYIQLQIWHGHETTQPLPNKIWIDNVKIYDLKRFIEPVALEIPFTIKENGEYVFLTRLFQNQQGGKIQIQLGNKNYTINTKDQLNKFVWKEINTIQLEKGNHKITLTNLGGFNAVNLFAFIPKQEYQNTQKQIEDILQDKRIIYILEAETDLYHQDSIVSNKYGGEASNGETLTLNQTSKAYNTIEILKPANYTFAIRSQGNLTIKIDQKEYKISTTQLNWTYIGPLCLHKGNHTIEITNPIQPQYEWNFNSADDLYQWKNYTRENQFGSLYTLTLDNGALKAELWNSTWGWKTINSPLIPVTPENTYQFDFYVSGENAHGVHAKIVEYDSNKTLLSAKIMKNIGSGNFTWKNINFKYTPSQNASYIQLQIWHGHETTQPLPNKIWIDNVRVYKYYGPSDLDVVWIYSTQNSNETLEDIFTPKENPAEIISYQKIDPTKYVVKVNATKSFMLSFAESYDPLWVAYVNGEKIQSIPLYGVINGFWINQTGLLEITIEYEPQKWFYYGLAVSLLTLTGCVLYLAKEPLYRLVSKIRKLKLASIKSLRKGITR